MAFLPLARKSDTPTNLNRRSLQQEKNRESISADRPSDWTYLLRRVESKGVSGGGGVAASATVVAAGQRGVSRSLAAAAASATVAAARSAAAVHSTMAATRSVAAVHSATTAVRLQQRGYCGGGGSATAQRWQQRGGGGSVSSGGGSAKRGCGAQRDGGSAVAAARRLRQIHRHRPKMRHHQRADVRVFVLGRGWRDDSVNGIVVVGSDGGALGDVHRGRRCAAAAADDANGNADDIVC